MPTHNNAPGGARSIVFPVRIHRLLAWAVLAVVCVGLTACGSVGAGTSTSTAAGAPSTSVSAPGPTITPPMPTTSLSPATTTTPKPIDVEISNGEVIGPEVFQVDRDDTVDLWLLADVDDEVHVHGYDIVFELEAGVPLNVSFVAGIPGVFEVELESAHTHFFDIEVSG